MNPEELGLKKNDNSENDNKLKHLGLIIFFVLAIVFVALSTHYGMNGYESFGRVIGYGLLYFIPLFFLKRKKNASNISAVLPLILIIAAFPRLIITGEENRVSIIQIDSFKKVTNHPAPYPMVTNKNNFLVTFEFDHFLLYL